MSSRTPASRLLVALAAVIAASACRPPAINLRPGQPTQVHLPRGESTRMTARVTGIRDTTVSYTSSNPAVASVSPTGTVTAVGPGTATITARSTVRPDLSKEVPFRVRQPGDPNTLINEVCPNQDARHFADSRPVSATVPYIHEYHDCQQLIVGNEYRSLVGIFAHANDTLPEAAFEDGRLAALIVNFRTNDGARPYPQLDLQPGLNCLILRSPGHERWEAAIVHQTSPFLTPSGAVQYGDCPDTMAWRHVPEARKRKLEVKLQRGVDLKGDPIVPPVARWDWDSTNRHNYIGVKCGRAWCEIGPPGFSRSVGMKDSANREIIKGYYDEQYLAGPTGTKSNVFGRISPGVHAKDTGQIKRDGNWYHVGTIEITAPRSDAAAFEHIRKRFNLRPRNEGAMLIGWGNMTIMARAEWDSLGDFALRINREPRRPSWQALFGLSDYAWRAVFHWHPETVNKFPTVRWRWLNPAETTWDHCPPDGCCEKAVTRISW